ncbi:MAG: plastocyanin/azurin family copper-binding protein [Bacteroidales bacterium]|jgi:plastocyanin
MKTKLLLVISAVLALINSLNAATHTVQNESLSFTPDDITINQGDTVIFDIGESHNVVEVDESIWDENGNTSNGGFSLDFGGGELVFDVPGTYYYVCQPHASSGMKGTIEVLPISAISGIGKSREILLNAFPNPVSDRLLVEFNVQQPTQVKIELVDITGQTVRGLITKNYTAGVHNESFDLSNLAPGTYFIHYETGTGSKVKSILKLE